MDYQNRTQWNETQSPHRSEKVSRYHYRNKLQTVGKNEEPTTSQVVRFLLLHAPLMIIFQRIPITATIYAAVIFITGLYYLAQDDKPTRTAWVIAYLAGAEILWRGAGAPYLISEYGKYSTMALSILVLLKYRSKNSAVLWPLLFVALLVPAIFVAPSFDRQAISYQLGGPVTLAVASMAFSTIEFKKADLQRLFLAVIAPTISMAFLIIFIGWTQDISFASGGANEEITGGIGANQVTSALSLGSTAAFFYIFTKPKSSFIRNLMISISVILLATSVLTFSRAGLWNTLGAVAMSIPFLFRSRWQGSNTFSVILVFSVLGYFVVFPFLNSVTGGAIVSRFSDLDTTGRDILVKIDYKVFQENPILGVGVGQSVYYHVPYFGYRKPTHTEYSRLLAEHGSLGVAALLLLASVTLSRITSKRSPFSKSVSVSFTTWALLYMTHAATRMVAPSFAFGLAAANFDLEEEPDKEDTQPIRRTPRYRRI